jgi:hypothetical protein
MRWEPSYVDGWADTLKLNVCGSVHHSIIHKENPTRCNSVSKFYLIFLCSSTFQGAGTTHPTTLHVCKTRGC